MNKPVGRSFCCISSFPYFFHIKNGRVKKKTSPLNIGQKFFTLFFLYQFLDFIHNIGYILVRDTRAGGNTKSLIKQFFGSTVYVTGIILEYRLQM